jgi:hypothetical protein
MHFHDVILGVVIRVELNYWIALKAWILLLNIAIYPLSLIQTVRSSCRRSKIPHRIVRVSLPIWQGQSIELYFRSVQILMPFFGSLNSNSLQALLLNKDLVLPAQKN